MQVAGADGAEEGAASAAAALVDGEEKIALLKEEAIQAVKAQMRALPNYSLYCRTQRVTLAEHDPVRRYLVGHFLGTAVTGLVVGPLLSIPPSVLPLTNLGMDGNTHGSSARRGSLAQSLYSKHQTNPWRPYTQAASQTEATRRPKAPQGAMSNMPGSSQDLKVPNAGPDPQKDHYSRSYSFLLQ